MYSIIVIYVREEDKVTPVRVSKSPYLAKPHARMLDMAQLFHGHTAWIASDIEARQVKTEARYRPAA